MLSKRYLYQKTEFSRNPLKTNEKQRLLLLLAALGPLLAALGPLLVALGPLLARLGPLLVALEPLLAALDPLWPPLGSLLVALGPHWLRSRPAAPKSPQNPPSLGKASLLSIAPVMGLVLL